MLYLYSCLVRRTLKAESVRGCTASSFSDMRAHLVLALAAMLSAASAATVATGITRATTTSIGANNLRLRGGLADDELATQV